MMHYNNYDGAYGYDLISIHSCEVVGFLAHYYRNYINDDYDNDNDVDLLYDDDDDLDVNDDYACGFTFGL